MVYRQGFFASQSKAVANSHLPNFHLDVTADWQDIGYPRTSFENAISLEPVQGEHGRYAGFAPKNWRSPRMHNDHPNATIMLLICR